MPRRYSELTKKVLLGLAVAGAVSIAAAAPGAVLALKLFQGKTEAQKSREEQKKIWEMFLRLKRNRLIILKEKGDGTFLVELTEDGKRKVKAIRLQDLCPLRPQKWDGLWRILIFDIPNKKKAIREVLRRKLKEWNFYQLQESVWVCPWPCEKEIEFVVELFGAHHFVNFLETRRIANDIRLKAYFRLLES